jgi:hypothetical protein
MFIVLHVVLILLMLQTVHDPTACRPIMRPHADAKQVSHGVAGRFAQEGVSGMIGSSSPASQPRQHARHDER